MRNPKQTLIPCVQPLPSGEFLGYVLSVYGKSTSIVHALAPATRACEANARLHADTMAQDLQRKSDESYAREIGTHVQTLANGLEIRANAGGAGSVYALFHPGAAAKDAGPWRGFVRTGESVGRPQHTFILDAWHPVRRRAGYKTNEGALKALRAVGEAQDGK